MSDNPGAQNSALDSVKLPQGQMPALTGSTSAQLQQLAEWLYEQHLELARYSKETQSKSVDAVLARVHTVAEKLKDLGDSSLDDNKLASLLSSDVSSSSNGASS